MSFRCAFKVAPILVLLILFSFANAKKSAAVTKLQIGVKHKPESCELQAQKDYCLWVSSVYISCHSFMQGKLTDGTIFGNSFERGDPIEFELGSDQVIKGLFRLATAHSFLLKRGPLLICIMTRLLFVILDGVQ
ncbi:hypothetical protein PTKIN_Ptkin12aG0111300 [Pterospermum kingtungense]